MPKISTNTPAKKSNTSKRPVGELSVDNLVALINSTWIQFTEDFVPLTNKQQVKFTKCSQLVATDPSTIQKNVPKSRAHAILNDILKCSEELFFLCALSIYPYYLGQLKTDRYLHALVEWRKNKPCPKGLRDAITHYYTSFPKRRTAYVPAYRTQLQEADLVDFVQNYTGEQRFLMIRIPDDINEQPAIEMSREMCQGLLKFVMERTQERMTAINVPQERG